MYYVLYIDFWKRNGGGGGRSGGEIVSDIHHLAPGGNTVIVFRCLLMLFYLMSCVFRGVVACFVFVWAWIPALVLYDLCAPVSFS